MIDGLLGVERIDVPIERHLSDIGEVFEVFPSTDSGCTCYGVKWEGWRYFVKHADEESAVPGLERAANLHRQVPHSALPRVLASFQTLSGRAQVYEWVDGVNVYEAKSRFYGLPVAERLRCLTVVYDVHQMIADAGFVAVDFYDGCLIYDFERRTTHLCDLDEYRSGPFRVVGDRLPGSTRFMAPEELQEGAVIDHVTNVFTLGRAALVLLGDGTGDEASWGWSPEAVAVARRATSVDRALRYRSVKEYLELWMQAARGP